MLTRTSPDTATAIARGLLAAPLVAAVAGFALFSWSIEMGLVMAFLFAVVATVITVLFAYPLLRWMMHRGHVSAASAFVTGAILGNVPAVIGIIGTYVRNGGGAVDFAGFLRPIVVGTCVGIAAAASFWVTAGRHLGGLDAANTPE